LLGGYPQQQGYNPQQQQQQPYPNPYASNPQQPPGNVMSICKKHSEACLPYYILIIITLDLTQSFLSNRWLWWLW
jgi:hypothetical protein